MSIEENHVITITYELRDGGPAGELIERMDANYPFHFFFGSQRLLPAFESNLKGLKEGSQFEFTLPPDEAYGPVVKDYIIALPRENFRIDGEEAANTIVRGNFITMKNERGEEFQGQILDFDEETVTVDFNHAMAGKTLHFTGSVLNVREANVDELVQKRYIPEEAL